jgi:hypothetical protein
LKIQKIKRGSIESLFCCNCGSDKWLSLFKYPIMILIDYRYLFSQHILCLSIKTNLNIKHLRFLPLLARLLGTSIPPFNNLSKYFLS